MVGRSARVPVSHVSVVQGGFDEHLHVSPEVGGRRTSAPSVYLVTNIFLPHARSAASIRYDKQVTVRHF